MLWSGVRASRRVYPGGTNPPARHFLQPVIVVILFAANFAGCATFGRRGAADEKIAAGQELTRQGVAEMEKGQWQQAEDLLKKALEESPDDAETRRYLAEAIWHRGSAAEALSQMAAAVRLNPSDANLALRAGQMCLDAGNADAALIHAEKAIRLNPQLATAWALRGRVFQRLNQTDRALADLQRALEFDPDNPNLLMDVALLYRQRGQAARCLTTLYHLHDLHPPGQETRSALVIEGLALMDVGRPRQAAEVFIKVAQRDQPDAEVLCYLAQAYSADGQYAEATTAANEALKIDATHAASRQLLAQLAARGPSAESQRR